VAGEEKQTVSTDPRLLGLLGKLALTPKRIFPLFSEAKTKLQAQKSTSRLLVPYRMIPSIFKMLVVDNVHALVSMGAHCLENMTIKGNPIFNSL